MGTTYSVIAALLLIYSIILSQSIYTINHNKTINTTKVAKGGAIFLSMVAEFVREISTTERT